MTKPTLVTGVDNLGRKVTVRFGSTQTEASKMTTREKVAEALGLPSDASDAQVRAKAEELGIIDTAEQRKAEGAKLVQAAVAEGKLMKRDMPVWRQKYEADPEGTRATLRILTGVDPKILAASERRPAQPSPEVSISESELQRRTRAALGLEAPIVPIAAAAATSGQAAFVGTKSKPLGPTSGPMGGGPTTGSRATVAKAELTTTAHGTVLYGGVPARYAADRGVHEVWTHEGWLDTAEFARRGMKPGDAAMAMHNTQRFGSAAAKKALEDGLPSGAALGVV